VQFGRNGEFKEVLPQQSCREEQHFDAFHLTGLWIEAGYDLVAELFGFLLGVGLVFVDVQDVGVAVVLERQLFCRSISPSFSLRAM
jgi:hypothetical protein